MDISQHVRRFHEIAELIFLGTATIPNMIEFRGIAILLSIAINEGDLPRDTFDEHWLAELRTATGRWHERTRAELQAANDAARAVKAGALWN